MTCSGCSGAVTKALSRIEGEPVLQNLLPWLSGYSGAGITYDVNLEKQEVTVRGPVDYDTVLEKIKKTGKEVRISASVVRREPHSLQVRSGETVE